MEELLYEIIEVRENKGKFVKVQRYEDARVQRDREIEIYFIRMF